MLTNERILEAEHNVQSYLRDGLLKKESLRNIVLQTYLRNNRESLLSARKLLSETDDLYKNTVDYIAKEYIDCISEFNKRFHNETKSLIIITDKLKLEEIADVVEKKICNMTFPDYDKDHLKIVLRKSLNL
jgi:hypothetical protein